MIRLSTLVGVLLLAIPQTACTADPDTASVIFTGTAPEQYQNDSQPVQIFYCNSTSLKETVSWKQSTTISVPYGDQDNNGHDYFVSKYYIASPPLPNQPSHGQQAILGLLDSDHFTVDEVGEHIPINMDYTLLQGVYLDDLIVDYNMFDPTCEELGICNIPINTRCPVFPYNPPNGEISGIGKGVGLLQNKGSGQGQVFLPFTDMSLLDPLHCTVSILNDIILDYEIFFDIGNGPQEEISLTDAYLKQNADHSRVDLVYVKRPQDQQGAGCVEHHESGSL